MKTKIRATLKGERIILKLTKPSIKFASVLFETIDNNREHLRKWLPWVKYTNTVEDSLKYLFEKEKKVETGIVYEYGIHLNNIYIGNIGIHDVNKANKECEIGYWLSEKYANKGIMTEALRILEKYIFEEIGFNRIQIRCDTENQASAGVAKKSNYYFEGTIRESSYNGYFDQLRDLFLFSKLKSEYNNQNNK